jgi:formate dehydrogenase subunit gamma
MNNDFIKRHSTSAIFMHWFNAVCWFLLLATGLGLINNVALSPVGIGWPKFMNALFNGGQYLLYAHVAVGSIWTLGFLLYILRSPNQHMVKFLKEMFTVSPARDASWLVKKGISMTLGKGILEKLKIDPELPEQGFYNVGQKLFAIPSVIGGVVIVATGVIMILSKFLTIAVWLVQWSILLHFIAVGLVFAGLLIHIYMAAIAPDERPAFWSMFSGKVPEEYARHHHALWYHSIKPELKN